MGSCLGYEEGSGLGFRSWFGVIWSYVQNYVEMGFGFGLGNQISSNLKHESGLGYCHLKK